MEFIHNAYKLRKKLTELLLRDFGIKERNRDLEWIQEHIKMNDEDLKLYSELVNKYSIRNPLKESYPEWLIENFRNTLLDVSRRLCCNLISANSIYITVESEYHQRRSYLNLAIGNCEFLLQEFQYIIDVIPVDINKLTPYIDSIEREISLIKGVRSYDNTILRKIKGASSTAVKAEESLCQDKEN